MPTLERPDGAEIHWDETGEGPTVLIATILYGDPEMFAGLVEDLAVDHRVITYDLRGTGRSSRQGPFDLAVDVIDLEALADHVGGISVAVAAGDAGMRVVRVAAARPDLVGTVVESGTSLLAAAAPDSEGLAGSTSVLRALVTLLEKDYRSAIRSIVESGNPNLSEDEMRDRVDRVVKHCSQEAAVSRMRFWIRDEVTETARALGDRLWILDHPGNPWFPRELVQRLPEFLPDARHESLEDGAMSRPDLTAAVIRRLTVGTGPSAGTQTHTSTTH
jgi:pimeloyl-ACP methyl ester carboxylesterase